MGLRAVHVEIQEGSNLNELGLVHMYKGYKKYANQTKLF